LYRAFFQLVIFSITIQVAIIARCQAEEISGADDLLDKLKSVDAMYLDAGITISGNEVLPANPMVPGSVAVPTKWELTIRGSLSAITHDAMTTPSPPFVAGKDQTQFLARPRYDPDGNFLVSSLAKDATVFTAAYSASREEVFALAVSPTGHVTNHGTTPIIEFHPKNAPELTLPQKKALWSTGRGLSGYIDHIDGVQHLNNGLIQLKCAAYESPPLPGTWILSVDPTAAYLVREASFFRNATGRGTPLIAITNHGLKWYGNLALPESCEWVYSSPPINEKYELSDITADLKFDERLFESAQAEMLPPYPDDTMLIDARVSPEKTLFPNALKQHAEYLKAHGPPKNLDFLNDGP